MKDSRKIFIVIGSISTIAIFILASLFYWFFYRPSSIISACSSIAHEKASKYLQEKQEKDGEFYKEGTFSPEARDLYYGFCLQDHGIEK